MPFGLKDKFKRIGTSSDHKFKKAGEISTEEKGKQKEAQNTDDATKKAVGSKTDEQTDENKQETIVDPKPDNHQAIEKRKVIENVKTPTDIHGRFWNKYVNFKLAYVEHSTVNKFIPNALALERLIIDTLEVVGETVWMEKNRPHFNPFAAATGLCYLYFIQNLRAGKRAGKLATEDATTLSRLFKVIPEETIMIPEPFIPFFEAIAATELKDAKYEWVIPTTPDLTNAANFRSFGTDATLNQIFTIVPNIPAMLSLLAQFGSLTSNEFDQHFGDERTYEPITLERANANDTTRMFGADVPTNTADWATAGSQTLNILQHCGMRIPFRFYNDNGKHVLRDLKRSEFYGETRAAGTNQVTSGVDIAFSGAAVPAQGGAAGTNLLETKSFVKLENFLFLEKTKSPAWTNYLWKNVNFVAEHFSGSRSLKLINETQGLEPSIICQLKTGGRHNNRYVYADANLGTTGTRDVTYFNHFKMREILGSFRTFRGDVTREHQLDAFAFAINANPPIHGVNERHYRTGEFFTDAGQGSTIQEIGYMDTDERGTIPMYKGYELDVVRPIFKTKAE